ncbi:MAG: EAL domain-containing protein [Sulfuricurvum sp.]|nr:EAL domain-containing protein [Sulfuricurvum sp.]
MSTPKQEKFASEYFRAVDSSYIVSTSDLSGRITYANDNLVEISKYSREELIGKPHSLLRHPSVSSDVFKNLWETIQSKRIWSGTLCNRAKDGEAYYVHMSISPILDDNNEITEYLALRYDVTDYVQQQEMIKESAFISTVANIQNTEALIRDIEKYPHPYLALININNFKIFNNLYGYTFGNEMIHTLAALIGTKLKSSQYTLYHIHADEFAILAEEEAFIPFLEEMGKIQDFIHKNGISIRGEDTHINISIASSDEPKEHLFMSCNMAMHYARSQHQPFVYYNNKNDFSKDYEANLYWTAKLRKAVNERQIKPFFQPIYNMKTGKVQKFESLMRIVDGDDIYTPFNFLDIAKQANLYGEISMILLEDTFKIIQDQPYDISINLCYEDIKNRVYTDRLFELLRMERKGGVILEIVESEGIDNYDDMNKFVEMVKSLGCKIAIDDFGTGYSNFEYLLKLNADYIKIDGSLIKNIDTDPDSEAIVRTILTFAQIKKIPVIAEFVSNENILIKIKEIGVEYAQGYLIGEPKPSLIGRTDIIECMAQDLLK